MVLARLWIKPKQHKKVGGRLRATGRAQGPSYNKKSRIAPAFSYLAVKQILASFDLVSLQAFRALGDNESNLLAFFQGFETITLNCTEMDE